MKILVINNKGEPLTHICDSLIGHETKVIMFHDIYENMYEQYDAVILSGGEIYEVKENPEKFSEEIKLIQNSNKPILGICLGMQLIGYTYGEKLMKLNTYYKGNFEVEIAKDCSLFTGINKKFLVPFNHGRCIDNPQYLDVIAHSGHCITAIQHSQKHIYGVQFHPEIVCEGINMRNIIHNFIRICEYEEKKQEA